MGASEASNGVRQSGLLCFHWDNLLLRKGCYVDHVTKHGKQEGVELSWHEYRVALEQGFEQQLMRQKTDTRMLMSSVESPLANGDRT